ncbi:MAG TPA: tetratricopeptide repeat protein [Gammaproteobacteria bacterium]|nr:tetratricopeptide repeat protein [Gammaproteobacteria bacterium]
MGTSSQAHATAEPSVKQNNLILYNILVAEIAASRGMRSIALHYYLKAIQQTNDPGVAEASTLLAISLEAPNEALISAECWAKEDPLNLQAQLITMTLLISQSVDKALPYLTRVIELDPKQIDHPIMEVQSRLSESSAKNLKEALNKIALARPNDPYAHLIAAESAVEQRDMNSATQWVDSALNQKPDLTSAIELKARLIRYQKNSDTPAIRFIKKQLEIFPKNNELRFFYANVLLDTAQTEAAKTELHQLTEDSKYGGSALLILADIYLKEKQWKEASNALKKAKKFPDAMDGAEYLLGQIDELQDNKSAAVERYSNVTKGPYQIPAVLRAIALLKETQSYKEAIYLIHNSNPSTFEEQKQLLLMEIDLLNESKTPDEAMQLANDILIKLPLDEDVLYSRAVTAIKLKKWEMAETDLKQILKQNPNNANALNALGYALSFNNHRHGEALEFINQALSLSPNNPLFMDTLGWAYYQSGNYHQSVHYLKIALDLSENPKIAAHLGEALWINNQKDEAKTILKKALETNKDDEELLNTLKRLQIELKN